MTIIRTARGFDFASASRRLNVGCGMDMKPGYLNVDFQDYHAPDVFADVRELADFPTGHFEEVFACDVLEHVGRTETPYTLAVWNRVLAPGGKLWIRTTSLMGLFELFRHKDYRSVAQQQLLTQFLFGTQAYTGDFHMTGFTEITMRHYVTAAGFRIDKLATRDQWLFEVWATKVSEPVDEGARIRARVRGVLEQREFVVECFRQVLGREPSPEDIAHHERLLDSGTSDRFQLVESILKSDEARQRQGGLSAGS
jgi:predicted SAM-dependent methyltransferase